MLSMINMATGFKKGLRNPPDKYYGIKLATGIGLGLLIFGIIAFLVIKLIHMEKVLKKK